MSAPELLQHVTLVAGREVEAQVLDLERDGAVTTLVLSRVPEDHALEDAPEVVLVWIGADGRYECPVRVHRERRGYGPVWEARAVGRVVRHQRRQHFRVTMNLPVRLAWEVPGEEVVHQYLPAVAADVSEGGILATVRDTPPAVGSTVEVTILLGVERLAHEATVVRHVDLASGGTGVALAFTDPGRHGDQLRRAAFEAERKRIAVRG